MLRITNLRINIIRIYESNPNATNNESTNDKEEDGRYAI